LTPADTSDRVPPLPAAAIRRRVPKNRRVHHL